MLGKRYRFPYKSLYKKVAQSPNSIRGKFGTLRFVDYTPRLSSDTLKFAVVVGKKLGKAAHRNKHKRRIRAIFYQDLIKKYNVSKNIAVMYISNTIPENFSELRDDLRRMIRKLLKYVKS